MATTVRSFAALATDLRPKFGQDVLLVAVDGLLGSGTTTFGRRLVENRCDSVLLDLGDFVTLSDLHTWWERFEAEALRPLLAGERARFQARDWGRDPLGRSLLEWRQVDPAPVVVVAGPTAARRAIAERVDHAIWVEVPPRICVERALHHVGQEHESAWLAAIQQQREFFVTDATRSRARLQVDGAPFLDHHPQREFVEIVRAQQVAS
jgi:hypothetical protein